MLAINMGHQQMDELLIAKGAQVNVPLGSTPPRLFSMPFLVVTPGRIPHLERVDVNATDSFGKTALLQAVESGDLEQAKMLIDKGANVNLSNSWGTYPISTI